MSQREFRADLNAYLAACRRSDTYHADRLRRKPETTHAPYWDSWLRYSTDREALALSGRTQGRPAKSTADRHTRRAERIAHACRRRRGGALIG